jgi:hypothetical protein
MMRDKRTPFTPEGFKHAAAEIAAFAYFFDSFIIILKNGKILRHRAADPESFYEWLQQNRVRVNNSYISQKIRPDSGISYLLEPPLS